jgi:hypothetical protein
MAIVSFPSISALGHRSHKHPHEGEDVEGPRPPAKPRDGAVRILRTPEELSEAITRAQEFEQRNAEVMRSRSQRYRNALGSQVKASKTGPAAG